MNALAPKQYSFANFELDGTRRLLLQNGKQVTLNSKTFDLLLVLVEQRGEILNREELIEKVWPGQFVEEGNLSVHISNLRKALGEGKRDNSFIVTVPGRGYSFVSELKTDNALVIERHRLAKIYVEEELEEVEPNAAAAAVSYPMAAIAASGSRPAWGKRRTIYLCSVLGLAVLLGGGYAIYRSRASAIVPFQQMSMKRLTSVGNVTTATISPDGKLFAFGSLDGEQQSLWLGHVDGGEPIQIRPPAHVVYLSIKFAPDGSSIYYTISENFAPGSLYRIPVFGGAPEKIRDNFRTMTFSPDGKQFAYIRFDESRNRSVLFAADSKDGSEHEMAVPSEMGTDWHSPAWSPDGASIALAANVAANESTVFVMNVADGSVRHLASHSWTEVRSMTWLPGDNGLVAVAIDKNAVYSQLWHISFPDGEVRRLTTDLSFYGLVTVSSDGSLLSTEGKNQANIWIAPTDDLSSAKQITFSSPGQVDGWYGVAWTHDGRIVYTADTDAGTNIWIMDADGKNRKQITPGGGSNIDPSLTADERFLIFQSNRSGHWAIWRSDLDGGGLTQLTGDEVAGEPTVSPDGKWIVYETSSDGSGELWRMSIDGGDAIKLSERTAEWPQISTDGKYVACGLYIDDQVKLAILPIDGGIPLKLYDLPRLFNFRWGIKWTPDGKAVTYRDWANGIWRQKLDGGQPERLEGLPTEKLAAYAWSPDNSKLAFTRLNIPRDVVLIENPPK